MPSTPVQLTTVNAASTNTVTTSSISPAANALVLAIVGSHTGGNHVATSASSTFSVRTDGQGRGWKALNNGHSDPGSVGSTTTWGSGNANTQIFWAVTTASPGSGTVTVNISSGILGFKVRIVQVEDVSLYMPIRQWHFTGAASGASFSSNLTIAPLSNSMLISTAYGRDLTTTIGPRSGWTELSEETSASSPTNVQYKTTTTDTDFGAEFGADPSAGIAGSCIEIRGPAVGEIPDPTRLSGYYQSAASTNTQLLPETGSVSVNNGDLVLIPVAVSLSTQVSSISSTFSVAAPGWQLAVASTATGSSNVRVEWWWAIASATESGTATITFNNSNFGTRGGWILSVPAGTFNETTPIRQTKTATQSATLAGGDFLIGTYDSAPLDPSLLLGVGVSATNSNQLWVRPRNGWLYLGPPVEEGGSQTPYIIYGARDQDFGGRFGSTSTAHDATGGVAWAAIEIQAATYIPVLTVDFEITKTELHASQTFAAVRITPYSGGSVYTVVTTSATPPSAAQIIAGQNHTGGAAVFRHAQYNPSGAFNVDITGLTANTQYYAYSVQVI